VTYTIPGVYTVKLTVTDNRGGKGNVTKTITVNPPANVPPVAHASATPSNGATPFITPLSSAGSSDADGAITGYSWDLGNGDTSTSPNPSATYIVTGTTAVDFTATLTVTDNDGASSVASTVVHVLPPNAPPVPVIVATPTSGAAPLTVNVNGASSTDDGTIANYDWDWGDASAHTSGATAATASHVYAQGTYTLRLSVTDDRGAVRSTTSTIVVSGSNVGRFRAAGRAAFLDRVERPGRVDREVQLELRERPDRAGYLHAVHVSDRRHLHGHFDGDRQQGWHGHCDRADQR
jgi:PKD repeat protein